VPDLAQVRNALESEAFVKPDGGVICCIDSTDHEQSTTPEPLLLESTVSCM